MGNLSNPIQPPPLPAPVQTATVVDEREPELSFWQEPWVQNGLPIVTSLAVHLGLILLGVLRFKAYQQPRTISYEQVIVPDATIVAGDVGGIPNPGLELTDPFNRAASDLVPESSKSDGWNKQPSKSLQAAVLGGQ